MRLDIAEDQSTGELTAVSASRDGNNNHGGATMGIMTESKTSGALKLQTMVDKRVKCIAKNYSVDE